MTRRELINQLLDGDMEEDIWIIIVDDDGHYRTTKTLRHSCYPIAYVCENVIVYEDDEDK